MVENSHYLLLGAPISKLFQPFRKSRITWLQECCIVLTCDPITEGPQCFRQWSHGHATSSLEPSTQRLVGDQRSDSTGALLLLLRQPFVKYFMGLEEVYEHTYRGAHETWCMVKSPVQFSLGINLIFYELYPSLDCDY